jgi:hypothetical protein
MAIGDRLIGWAKQWNLFCRQVICVQCMMTQDVDSADKSFVHDPHCAKATDLLQYPWIELTEIMRDLPKD